MPNLPRIAWVFYFVAAVAGACATVHADEPAPAPRLLKTLLVVNLALHGADLAQTSTCLAAGVCHEGNPVLAPLADHPAVFGATKMSLAAGLNVLTWQLHRTHPRFALALVVAEMALEGVVVAHNARTLAAVHR